MKRESMNIRRVIRANRLLAEQGHNGDTLPALNELATLRKEVERLHGDVEALRVEVEAAMPAMQAYAAANPMHDYRGVTQDPNGVHAWLLRNMKTAF